MISTETINELNPHRMYTTPELMKLFNLKRHKVLKLKTTVEFVKGRPLRFKGASLIEHLKKLLKQA